MSTGSSGAAPGDSNPSTSRDVLPHTLVTLPPPRASSACNLKMQTGSVHANGASRGPSSTEARLTRRAAVSRALCRVLRLPAAAQVDSPPAGRRFAPPTPRIQRSWSSPQHTPGGCRDEHQPEDIKLMLTAGEPPAAAATSSSTPSRSSGSVPGSRSSSAVPRQFAQAWHAQEARCKQLQEQVNRL